MFPHLIEFMYRRDLPAAVQDAEPLCWLLQLADRFETPSCVTQCVTRLLSTPLTLLDAALYVALPQPLKARPALRRLMDAVCALTGWSYDAVTRADSVATLSFPCMVQLAHALRGQDEHAEALLQLLLEWLRADATARWAGFGFLLLPLLDFSAMSPAFLREVEQCPELSSPEGRALLEYARKRAAPPDAVDVQVDVQDPAAQAPAGAPAPVAPVRPARGSGGALGIGIFLLAVILFLILTLAPGPKAGKKH